MSRTDADQRDDRGRTLLRLARESLQGSLDGSPEPSIPDAPWLHQPAATFVTVKVDGELRGCIGALRPHRALGEDVVANTRLACFGDPRFPPIAREEAKRTRLEVSVLSPLEPMPVESREELLREVRPGEDGLYYEGPGHHAVFLPQVWESLPRKEEFVGRLLRKGGLDGEAWPEGIRWWRFSVEKFVEGEAAEAS